MNDLISREQAIEEIKSVFEWHDFVTVDRLVEHIKALPSAQKKGKWILCDNQRQEDVNNGNYMFFCSNCLKADLHAKAQEVPYCWWCGASMRGEEDG